MTFDVLYDPWIPVTTREGTAEELGILPLLKNAHTLSAISSASPLVEYGIYRLLCAFVMDMLRPETDEDLEDLLEEGCFSEERIEAYRAECMADGASFDLFDPKRPFLQCAYDPRWDSEKNLKPVSQLNQALPHGNNHMLFEHQPLLDYRFSPAEAAQYLCTISYFCTSGTDGPSYVNGSPPLYVLPLGESLFETLVYSMVPQNTVTIPYAKPPIFWRSKDLVEPTKELASTSLLFGMTLPTRRICLIPEEDGSIRLVYYQKGLNYLGYEAWTDPHVAYLFTEKGRSSLKPQQEKDVWRNTGYLVGDENAAQGRYQAPLVIQQYRKIGRSQILRMGVYGMATEPGKATCQTTQHAELRYPRKLLDNEYGRQIISAGLQDVENGARALKYALQKMCGRTRQGQTVAAQCRTMAALCQTVVAQCLTNYYASCQTLFWSRLCPQAAEADINRDVSNEIRPNWLEEICHVAKEEFNRSADAVSMGGRYLILRSEAERELFVTLKKIRKGVE